jgi:hypothetical protein
MNYPEVSPRTIWNFRQNNPELVIKDAREYLGLNEEQCELLRTILLARGVNKWLKVRRDLIAYKKQLKHEIRRLQEEIAALKAQLRTGFDHKVYHNYIRNKALLAKLSSIRGDLKQLCMTDRWQIWPRSSSRNVLKEMNTIKCSD